MKFSQFPEKLIDKTFLYPTDTTFGLGCNAFDEKLVNKIFKIKERSEDKKMVLLVDTQSRLMDLVKVPEMAWQLMELSDKPLTLVYDQPLAIPDFLLAKDGTVAIRLSKDALCKKIIQSVKNPIISTSANISNQQNPSHYEQIDAKILEKIEYIFPECKNFAPQYVSSSIIKISEGGLVKVIRA